MDEIMGGIIVAIVFAPASTIGPISIADLPVLHAFAQSN